MNMRERQAAFNRSTAANWDAYTEHRHQLSSLLSALPRSATSLRLCVLGAGNCNDLDLDQARTIFQEIHLVDLDPQALEMGVSKQLQSDRKGIVVHAPCDLTGCIDLWPSELETLSDSRSRQIVSLLDAFEPKICEHGPFDVVVSTCLLTQLMSAVLLRSWSLEQQWSFASQIRRQHLKLILRLMGPHGTGIFLTDLVSSLTAPELLTHPDRDWLRAIPHYVAQKNFFTGTNPAAIHAECLQLNERTGHPLVIEPIHPWVWKQMESKAYLVWGMKLLR